MMLTLTLDEAAAAALATRQLAGVPTIGLDSVPGFRARGMLAMFKFDESSSIGNIAVPVLVVPGDRDPVLRPYASEHIGSVIPGATLAALAPAKHMGFMERHAEFDAVIARFIDFHAPIPVRS